MLILYDIGHIKLDGLTNYKELKLDREINIEDTLSFLYPISDPKHDLIQEECYIRTQDNEYIVKEVNYSDDDWTEYICKINIESIKGKDVSHFETVEQSCTNSVNLALAGTGWTIGTCDVTKLRTVRKNNCNAYIVLQEIQSAYTCEMSFDAIAKKVYIYQSLGTDKGSYFAEQLNLKKLDVQRNSYDYITRLIPLGKDSLGIASINGGLNYVENYQYSNKIITAFWEDNRYTDAPSLLEDATARLDYLSKPYKAYKADIIDLANINTQYSILDYSLGDTITLLAKSKNTKEKQRIIKLTQYPDEPERNTCEIANKLLSLEYLQVRFVDTADVVDTVTTIDGLVDGSKVDGIDWNILQNIHVVTADIQDASIVTAKIGNAQITTALIADASITNAKIDRASINKLQVVTADIVDANITTAKIGSLAVSTAQIQDAAITTAKIGNAQIFSAKIADAQITTAKIALGAITTALIDVAAIGTTQIADGSITDAKIVGLTANKITAGTINAGVITVTNLNAANITVGTINGTQIAAGAIDVTKLGTILVNDINSKITQTAVDTSINAIQIGGRNLLTNSDFNSGFAGWTSNGYTSFTKETADLPVGAISGGKLVCPGSYAGLYGRNDMIYTLNETYTFSIYLKSNVAVDFWFGLNDGGLNNVAHVTTSWAKYSFSFVSNGASNVIMLYPLAACTIIISNIKIEKGNKATDWTPAPEDVDATIATAQATANGKNKVTYSTSVPGTTANAIGDIWFQKNVSNVIIGQWEGLGGTSWSAKTIDNVVIANLDAGKITTGFLSAARIDALTITSDKLSTNSVIAGKVAANAITTGTIAAGVVNADAIATNAITAIKIVANTITGDKLVVDAITAREIAAHVITANEIVANTITAAEIKAYTITAGQIQAGTITTNELNSTVGSGLDISSNTSITLKADKTYVDAIQIGGRNLVYDSNFELGLSTISNGYAIGNPGYITPHSGTKYAYKYVVSSGDDYGFFSSLIPVIAGQTYTISYWTAYAGDYNSANDFYYENTGYGVVHGISSGTDPHIAITADQVWRKLGTTFTIPTGVTQILLRFGAQGGGGGAWNAVDDIKVELGNKATDWTPAPEDVQGQINSATTRIYNAEQLITPTAIVSTVRSSTSYIYDLDAKVGDTEIISMINQTAESITISATKIGLLGAVNIPNLDAAKITSGTINASVIAVTNLNATNITVGTLAAARIQAASLNASVLVSNSITATQIAADTITATQIAAGTITATEIATNAITAIKIVAGAITVDKLNVATINASGIYTGTLTAAQINAVAISANSIAGGTISGVTINVETDLTVGANIYMGNTSTGVGKTITFFTGDINSYSYATMYVGKPNYPTDNYTFLSLNARSIRFNSYGVPQWRLENLALESQLNSYIKPFNAGNRCYLDYDNAGAGTVLVVRNIYGAAVGTIAITP